MWSADLISVSMANEPEGCDKQGIEGNGVHTACICQHTVYSTTPT